MKRIVILFSGQGSQFPGMGEQLLARDASVQALFDTASAVLDMDMRRLCCDARADELTRTENTQPALLLCSVATYRLWQASTGITPAAMAGHSLGELSALVAAEALSLEDGLRLARARGLAMSRCELSARAGMSAVTRLERERVAEICADLEGFGSELVIANHNAPRECVLSGTFAALERAGDALKAAGASIIPLKVSSPFHSPLLASAADAFAAALETVEIARPRVPVLANVDARPHGEGTEIGASLLRQIAAPVRWVECMRALHEQGTDVYLEAGPGSVLKRLTQKNLPGAVAYALGEAGEQALIEQEFAAELRAMREPVSLIGKCLAVAVCTRNQNWDEAQYQAGVVQPYRKLQALQERLEDEERRASEAEMRDALGLLARIFATKGTPAEEQSWRFEQILAASGTAGLFAAELANAGGVWSAAR